MVAKLQRKLRIEHEKINLLYTFIGYNDVTDWM